MLVTVPSPAAVATPLDERLASGPISWGVCEVPGWGVQLPPEDVLAEMRSLGFQATQLSLVAAVRAGVFRPLGAGDAPLAETVGALEEGGYRGWYVLEQDSALASAELPSGRGPARDVRRSIDYLRAVMGAARATTRKEGSE